MPKVQASMRVNFTFLILLERIDAKQQASMLQNTDSGFSEKHRCVKDKHRCLEFLHESTSGLCREESMLPLQASMLAVYFAQIAAADFKF